MKTFEMLVIGLVATLLFVSLIEHKEGKEFRQKMMRSGDCPCKKKTASDPLIDNAPVTGDML